VYLSGLVLKLPSASVLSETMSKAACFLSYVEYRPNKIQQYYEKQITLSRGHIQEEEGKRKLRK
jgi:hypothetical protein